MRRFLIVLVLLAGTGNMVFAAAVCDYCRRPLRGNYLETSDGHRYCSRKCYEQTLPHCKVCGKLITGTAIRSGNDFYCSRKCFESQLPVCHGCGRHAAKGKIFKSCGRQFFYCESCAALPLCFACMLPAVGGSRLEDGRFICSECRATAVWTPQEAEKVLTAVRQVLRQQFGIGTDHRIELQLVDLPTLNRLSHNNSPGMELGLFVYNATINTIEKRRLTLTGIKTETSTYRSDVTYTIYCLSGTPRHKLVEVLAHELGHDWMQEYYPGVGETKIREGLAEYCAYLVNLHYGRREMNLRLSNNSDAIYGDGFRLIYRIGGDRGDWAAVRRFLSRNER
ncbi:MAG: hypothetical protein PHQ27_08840 [Victivallales bacterium]|nr:hypothetical protein [Victivallales bacterium]